MMMICINEKSSKSYVNFATRRVVEFRKYSNVCSSVSVSDCFMFSSLKTANEKQEGFSLVLDQQFKYNLRNDQTILTQRQTFEYLHLAFRPFYLELQNWRSGVGDMTSIAEVTTCAVETHQRE